MRGYGQEDRRVRVLGIRRALLESGSPECMALQGPSDPDSQARPGACKWSALEPLVLNRRDFQRVRESLLGACFGVGLPEQRGHAGGGRPQARGREGLVRLLLEIEGTLRRRVRLLGEKRLAVHAEIVRGSFLYFLAFLDAERLEPGNVALSHFDISGSGVCFPTQVRHRAGEHLFALLFLPVDPLPPLKLELEVVRPSQPILPAGRAYLTAARFLNLEADTRARVLAYVAARQKERMLEGAYGLGCPTDPSLPARGRLL